MTDAKEFTIRRAISGDRDFIISLVPRLTAFGPPEWRDVENMTSVDATLLISRFEDPDDETAIYVAEDVDGSILGFIHLQPGSAKSYTTSPEAYQLYLKGKYNANKFTKDGFRQSLDNFNQRSILTLLFTNSY